MFVNINNIPAALTLFKYLQNSLQQCPDLSNCAEKLRVKVAFDYVVEECKQLVIYKHNDRSF